ncbi:MAG: nicotinate (nicotinamide) nucleotide adenylyltransferase [Epsilonproteobacteria bacterium]|nr:nicotinate (nicotinamide) nucleotide adenylyltransferase [Campylobacterota bacterium]
MKTALFGGSFDPPHLGHIEIVKKAGDFCDKVIIMPNYLNPLKKNFSAPANLRYEWLKKIFNKYPFVEVSDYEIKQQKPVYTIDTVKHFKPDFFIIGSDNLKTLHLWKDIDKLKNMVEFVVAKRGDIDINLLKKHNISKIIDINIPISSTMIREGNFSYLPEEIEKEIIEFYKRSINESKS